MLKYFVLVYHRPLGKLIREIEVFERADRRRALERRFALEREYAGQKDIEIVVLGAESEEAIRKTHGRYFKTVRELLADMQATVGGMSAAS